jgi:hypothetical protein
MADATMGTTRFEKRPNGRSPAMPVWTRGASAGSASPRSSHRRRPRRWRIRCSSRRREDIRSPGNRRCSRTGTSSSSRSAETRFTAGAGAPGRQSCCATDGAGTRDSSSRSSRRWSEGFRAVAVDMPGHGRSGGRSSSLVHFAETLHSVDAVQRPSPGAVARRPARSRRRTSSASNRSAWPLASEWLHVQAIAKLSFSGQATSTTNSWYATPPELVTAMRTFCGPRCADLGSHASAPVTGSMFMPSGACSSAHAWGPVPSAATSPVVE